MQTGLFGVIIQSTAKEVQKIVNCVSLVYFSATKTTQKNLRAIAEGIGLPVKEYDFTLPQNRSADIAFEIGRAHV